MAAGWTTERSGYQSVEPSRSEEPRRKAGLFFDLTAREPSSQNCRLVTLRVVICLVALLLSACRGLDDPGASVGIFFPRHGLRGPYTLAALEGRLEVRDGCLWLVQSDGIRYLPIWPGGYGMRGTVGALRVSDSAGQVVAAEGQTVTLVGGQYSAADARRVMGRDEPGACRGGFWLVGSVTARAERSSTP